MSDDNDDDNDVNDNHDDDEDDDDDDYAFRLQGVRCLQTFPCIF